jgi:hypothetical protein
LHRSNSTQENKKNEPHPWLEEKVYAHLRQRTVDLVKRSVDALRKNKQRVSLSTIVARSKELDAEGKGISESAILDNEEARAYYEQHRTWQGNRKRRAKPLTVASPAKIGPVKSDRNEQRVRQRYLRMGKETLVDRLITVERTSAEERERWLLQQDELLTWRLRAEAAEAQVKQARELQAREVKSPLPTRTSSSKPRQHKRAERTTGTLPKQLVSLLAFARLHNIAEMTVQTHMDMGLFSVERGTWMDTDEAEVALALDEKGRTAFYHLYHSFPQFLSCPHCAHGYQGSVPGQD